MVGNNSRKEFGKALRVLRRRNENNYTLEDLAQQVDCSITYLSAIERGDRNPMSVSKLMKLLKFLGEESEAERMIELTLNARESIEFHMDRNSKQWTDVLVALARRSEEGNLDDETAKKIQDILDKQGN